ncbi:MAG: histidine kinase, partial [Methanoregula sp.]
MRPSNSVSGKSHSFSQTLLISMIILVMFIVGFMTIYDYVNLKSSIDSEFTSFQNQSETSIAEALRQDDLATTILDDQLNWQMERGFDPLFAEYNRSGKNPANMDLSGVKKSLGNEYDIYIINESGVIVYTTYSPEQGEDFRSIPYFFTYLTRIRLSQGFFADRVVRDISTGNLEKFAYEPTPDHQYIM